MESVPGLWLQLCRRSRIFVRPKELMMYKELYQFLLLHKELPVPGVGTFLLDRVSASVDFPNKQITAPAYQLSLSPDVEVPEKSFFHKLSGLLHQSSRDTVIQFNDFVFELKRQVMNGTVIEWKGIGILQKGLAGDIKLMPSSDWPFQAPVAAEKVIREKPEHLVRVGEEEKTSAEMTAMLSQPEEKKSYWWVYAMIAGVLSVIFIGWHLSEEGVDVNATCNGTKLVPLENTATYKILQ
jgi:hypothetical protein